MFFKTSPLCDQVSGMEAKLIGKPLASPFKRGLALGLDLVIGTLMVLPAFLLCLYVVFSFQAPGFISRYSTMFTEPDFEKRGEMFGECSVDMIILMARWKPEILPEDFLDAGTRRDRPKLRTLLDGYSWKATSDIQFSSFDTCNKHFVFGRDAILGKWASKFSIFTMFFVYFTLSLWLGKGRTPGKAILGLRVVPINGKKLSLFTCFGRCGGYTASLSTFGLGFFQVLWHGNRQTSHDQLAETFVLDERSAR